MTITNQTTRTVASGNGVTTSFNYGFLIPELGAVALTYIDSLGAETAVATAGLTITGIGNTAGGAVGYAPGGNPIGTNSLFVIQRASPYTQEASYTNQDGYYPATTEEALDWLAYQTQQLNDKISRALLVSVGNQLPLNTFPIESVRAGYAIGFDDDGQLTLMEPGSGSPVTSYWSGVLQTTNAATAQTALGATTVGAAVFTATNAAQAQTALGDAIKALGALTPAASKFGYFTGADAAALADFTGPNVASWTPVITAATPGTLSITYTHQIGRYMRIGGVVIAWFSLQTATFTVGTATGNLMVSGLPVSGLSVTGGLWQGGMGSWSVITKANYTQITPHIGTGTAMTFVASGSGQNVSNVAITEVGAGLTLRGCLIYPVA